MCIAEKNKKMCNCNFSRNKNRFLQREKSLVHRSKMVIFLSVDLAQNIRFAIPVCALNLVLAVENYEDMHSSVLQMKKKKKTCKAFSYQIVLIAPSNSRNKWCSLMPNLYFNLISRTYKSLRGKSLEFFVVENYKQQ